MSRQFKRVAVLGLGLLGGSVAMAARRAGIARSIVAAGRRQEPLRKAAAAGIVDEIGAPAEVAEGADLIVLATPVGSMAKILGEIVPHLGAGALVTDVGSIKGELVDSLPNLLPEGIHYVGAHPMAGSHERGVVNARAELFDGACCVVTPQSSTPPGALSAVVGFWRALGSRVEVRTPHDHDIGVAWVSHVPHVVAFAYAHALAQAPRETSGLAGSGFRDFIRIARSDPEMWSEILNTNRKAIAGPLQVFGRSLAELGRAIESGNLETQENFLTLARDALAGVTLESPGRADGDECENVRSGDADPEIQADRLSADARRVKTNNE